MAYGRRAHVPKLYADVSIIIFFRVASSDMRVVKPGLYGQVYNLV